MPDSPPPPNTKSSPKTGTGFQSGTSHPRFVPDALLLEQLRDIPLGTLHLTGAIETRARSMRYAEAVCTVCGKHRWVLTWNITSGKTKNCTCQRGKYKDPRAKTLGQRYDAMVQRCERDTHVSSKNYKGRGIRCLFTSREHFIRWALETWPHSDYKSLDFDRIDNDGDYSPENLRLVDRKTNLANRRKRRSSTTS